MVAYYLLLSLFPLTIAIGNILPFFNILPERVLPYVNILLPPDIQTVLDPIITSLLTRSSGGLLSISAIGLLWSAGRGINYLQKAMNKAYGVTPKGIPLMKRLLSMAMVFATVILLCAFILIYSVGQTILSHLAENFEWALQVKWYLDNFKWPVTFAVMVVLLLLVYRLVPDVKLRLRHTWPGAVFATLGLVLLTQLFTLYMEFASRSITSYGTLAAFFLLMFWLNFSCGILILGAVLNASLQEIREGKPEVQVGWLDNYLLAKFETWREKRNKTGKKEQIKSEKTQPGQQAEKHDEESADIGEE